jgi:hypothetical protein
MIFIETPIFTKLITGLLPDDGYKELQRTLLVRPDIGAIIKGSGGLRKVRWNLPNEGKRGSLRIIYYWDIPESIYMLLPYKKSKKEDLTKEQIKILSQLMKEYLK